MKVVANTLDLLWDRNLDHTQHMERSFVSSGSIIFELAPGDVLTTERVYEAIKDNDDLYPACKPMLLADAIKWGVRILPHIGSMCAVEVTLHWDEGADVPERERTMDDWREAA